MTRLTIKQLENGKWAAFTGAKYFTATVSDTEKEARVARLIQIAHEKQAEMDEIHRQLEKLGAVSAADPYGYLA